LLGAPIEWLRAKVGALSNDAHGRRWRAWETAQVDDQELWKKDPHANKAAKAFALHDIDWPRAFPMLLDLAQRGSVWSMTRVAYCYFRGLGVSPDLVEAENWYRRAYEAGSQRALLDYGRLLARRGEFVRREAVYRAGAARDWAPASYLLARLLIERSNTPKAYLEARPLLERAAVQGSPAAKWWLARYMARGRFGIREIPRGIRLAIDYSKELRAEPDREITIGSDDQGSQAAAA